MSLPPAHNHRVDAPWRPAEINWHSSIREPSLRAKLTRRPSRHLNWFTRLLVMLARSLAFSSLLWTAHHGTARFVMSSGYFLFRPSTTTATGARSAILNRG